MTRLRMRPRLGGRLKMLSVLLAMGLSIASCSPGTAIDTACVAFAPIYPSRHDVLTDGTARQILTHDRTGATLCGWKPPAKP